MREHGEREREKMAPFVVRFLRHALADKTPTRSECDQREREREIQVDVREEETVATP